MSDEVVGGSSGVGKRNLNDVFCLGCSREKFVLGCGRGACSELLHVVFELVDGFFLRSGEFGFLGEELIVRIEGEQKSDGDEDGPFFDGPRPEFDSASSVDGQ